MIGENQSWRTRREAGTERRILFHLPGDASNRVDIARLAGGRGFGAARDHDFDRIL
jgi:hypothetical protein